MGATTRRMMGTGVLVLAAMAGFTACSDDEAPRVSQEAYNEAATTLCDRHYEPEFAVIANVETVGQSDAEWVALVRTEYVPRIRAIVRGLVRNGLPAERAAEYSEALSNVLANLSEFDDEDEAYHLLDRLRHGLADDENPLLAAQEQLRDADVRC